MAKGEFELLVKTSSAKTREESLRAVFGEDKPSHMHRKNHDLAYDHGYGRGLATGVDDAMHEATGKVEKSLGLFEGAEFLVSDPGYQSLVRVFGMAHAQAARGKGKERHANAQPFEHQRTLSLARTLKDPVGSLVIQVLKKTTEGLCMDDPARTKAELLGAINYLAGMVILLDERPAQPQTDEEEDQPVIQMGKPAEPMAGKAKTVSTETLLEAFEGMPTADREHFLKVFLGK